MDSFHDKVTPVPWQESWATIFDEERKRIEAALSADAIAAKVYHVGSTSVQGMISKPVIDILVSPHELFSLEETAAALEKIGYSNLGECGRPGRYFMSKDDTPNEAFYLHLCYEDHQVAKDQLFFQKLERSIPEVLQNHISVKSAAAELFPEDRDSYREMKGWYIDAVLAAARNAERKMEDDDRIKYWMYEIEMSDEMKRVILVLTARIVEDADGQILILPKEIHIEQSVLFIQKIGSCLLLSPLAHDLELRKQGGGVCRTVPLQ